MLDGEEAFKLYDTFGMPLDFIQDAARDQGISSIRRALIAHWRNRRLAPRFLERRGEADGESGVSATAEIGV